MIRFTWETTDWTVSCFCEANATDARLRISAGPAIEELLTFLLGHCIDRSDDELQVKYPGLKIIAKEAASISFQQTFGTNNLTFAFK